VRKSALTKEYVAAEVTAREAGLPVVLSSDTVEMAFPASETAPVGGDWKTASWETDATSTPPRYLARCLVGPGGTVVLAANTYDVWVRVTHSPELAVLQILEPDGTPTKLEVY
jgi:hypothetical protein